LNKFSSSDAGVFNVIPEKDRKNLGLFVDIVKNPVNSLVDSAQSKVNEEVTKNIAAQVTEPLVRSQSFLKSRVAPGKKGK
jgi:hypothetical protein